MYLSKMLRISSILDKLKDVKGGFKTAFLALNPIDQQDFISLSPKIAVVTKRLLRKNKIIQQPQPQLLLDEYEHEYKEYIKLKTKYAEKSKDEIKEVKLSYHEILTQAINDIVKLGYDINTVTLCDTIYINIAEGKSIVWQQLSNLASNANTDIKRRVIKNFIKRSSRDNYDENKKWIKYYAG